METAGLKNRQLKNKNCLNVSVVCVSVYVCELGLFSALDLSISILSELHQYHHSNSHIYVTCRSESWRQPLMAGY